MMDILNVALILAMEVHCTRETSRNSRAVIAHLFNPQAPRLDCVSISNKNKEPVLDVNLLRSLSKAQAPSWTHVDIVEIPPDLIHSIITHRNSPTLHSCLVSYTQTRHILHTLYTTQKSTTCSSPAHSAPHSSVHPSPSRLPQFSSLPP